VQRDFDRRSIADVNFFEKIEGAARDFSATAEPFVEVIIAKQRIMFPWRPLHGDESTEYRPLGDDWQANAIIASRCRVVF